MRLLSAILLALALFACDRGEEPKVLYPAGQFSLTDQSGARFGTEELRGKTWIAAFFFTRCPTVCPKITKRMKELQATAKAKRVPVHFVSISVDPENDTPPVLTEYAQKNQLDTGSWTLLTGDYDTVKKTVLEGFKVALEGKADSSAEDYGIMHGSHLLLVDKNGQIRGYYKTSEDHDMKMILVHARAIGK
ncbi:MAG: SCO family protein [Polyangiaceae bacterium]|nr:SCO family protein [Polyangiaceae bacterium]MCL4756233.1 SCO family protein [Myxococcales bacterium]